MHYFLLFFSIFLEAAKTVVSNLFSKQELKQNRDIFRFNWIFYLGSFLILLCFPSSLPSLYTVITAVIFALVTTASQYFCLLALRCGPMSLTTFLQGSSLLIPTFFGFLFMGEDPSSILFWISLVLLLFSMALVLISKQGGVNLRWILFAIGAFVFTGAIGIMQSIHQGSPHSAELIPFLQIAFALCALFNFVGQCFCPRKKEEPSFSLASRTTVMAVGSGVAMGAVNLINLYLSGVMDKHIFFPIVNGGFIFLSTIAAVIFFRERLSPRQWVGLAIGIVQLAIIAL
jgi:drug/metabolite transporter (DMT)-like permease